MCEVLATEALKSLDGTAADDADDADEADEAAAEGGKGGKAAEGEQGASEDGGMKSTADMAAGAKTDSGGGKGSTHTWSNGQEPLLVQMLAEELGVCGGAPRAQRHPRACSGALATRSSLQGQLALQTVRCPRVV